MTFKVISEGKTYEFPDGAEIVLDLGSDININEKGLQKHFDKIREEFNRHVNVTGVGPSSPPVMFPSTRWQRFKKRFKYQVWKVAFIIKHLITSPFTRDKE